MGVILCKTHGKCGIVHVCNHVYQSYEDNNHNSLSYTLLRDQSGMTFYLCKMCIVKYGFIETQILDFDDLQIIGDDLRAVCSVCFQNLARRGMR